MSYEELLRQRADIYRPTYEAQTGPEAKPVWPSTPHAAGVKCRIQQLQAAERDKEHGAVVATHQSYWPYGVDLLERDRVVVDGATYDVQGVNTDAAGAGHHAEATLKSVE